MAPVVILVKATWADMLHGFNAGSNHHAKAIMAQARPGRRFTACGRSLSPAEGSARSPLSEQMLAAREMVGRLHSGTVKTASLSEFMGRRFGLIGKRIWFSDSKLLSASDFRFWRLTVSIS